MDDLEQEPASQEHTNRDEATPEPPAEPADEQVLPPEDPIKKQERLDFFRQHVSESSSHTREMEVALEPRRLTESLGRMPDKKIDEDLLKRYLIVKQDLFGSESERKAAELMKVESNIVQPLIAKLRDCAFIEQTQIENCISATREAFFGMILHDRMTADKISELFNGEIHVLENPGEEAVEHKGTENMASYLKFDGERYHIYVYKNFFSETSREMAFHLRHEFAHASSIPIWGERYVDFKNAARNPSENYNSFSDVPELQQVLYLAANPELAKPFFREYIVKLLEAAETAVSSSDREFYLQRACVEMVADLGAHFLEGSNSIGGMLDLRAKYFSEQDPDKCLEILCQLEEVASKDDLFEKYRIDAMTPPAEIVARLCQSDRLQGLFNTSKIWQERMTKVFENNGANLRGPQEFNEDDMFEGEEIEYQGAFSQPSHWYDEPVAAPKEQKSQGTVEAILSIWELITGKSNGK